MNLVLKQKCHNIHFFKGGKKHLSVDHLEWMSMWLTIQHEWRNIDKESFNLIRTSGLQTRNTKNLSTMVPHMITHTQRACACTHTLTEQCHKLQALNNPRTQQFLYKISEAQQHFYPPINLIKDTFNVLLNYTFT